MSDISNLSRKHKRRDRSKTNSDAITTLVPNCNKRPLDEINSSNSDGVKRRAISATTGNENQECSRIFVNNREGKIDQNCDVSINLILEYKSITTSDSICNKRNSITRFERSLPTEILYEIFKYLSQSDLFYAFLNLNQHFDKVLQPFTQHIDCSKLSIEQFEHIRNHLYNAKSLLINNQVINILTYNEGACV